MTTHPRRRHFLEVEVLPADEPVPYVLTAAAWRLLAAAPSPTLLPPLSPDGPPAATETRSTP